MKFEIAMNESRSMWGKGQRPPLEVEKEALREFEGSAMYSMMERTYAKYFTEFEKNNRHEFEQYHLNAFSKMRFYDNQEQFIKDELDKIYPFPIDRTLTKFKYPTKKYVKNKIKFAVAVNSGKIYDPKNIP